MTDAIARRLSQREQQIQESIARGIPCSIDVWSLIIPEASTNYVLNPSAETTGNFAARNAATVTRVSTYQWRGIYCYRVQTTAIDEGIELTLATLTNSVHYVSMQVRGLLPEFWQWSLDNANWRRPKRLKDDNGWRFYGAVFPASEANGSTTLYIRHLSGTSSDFYIDAIQVEAKSYWTTYIDGDQSGCAWSGTSHASYSTRSAQSRAGGRVRGISSFYDIYIAQWSGTGIVPIDYNYSPQSLLPGVITQDYKIKQRPITFSLEVPSVEPMGVQTRLGPLMRAVSPGLVSPRQPMRLRYSGGAKELEIACDYDGGLEGGFEWKNTTKVPLRVVASDDPFFYEILEAGVVLTSKQSVASADRVIKRIDGLWSALSTGLNGAVYTIEVAADGTVYIGGEFTNAGGIAAADHICKYNPLTNTFSALGSGVTTGNDVRAIAIAADGTVYFGGDFTNAGGVAAADYIAQYNPATDTISAVGAGLDNVVRALGFALNGDLWIGGSVFGGAINNYIARWNGAAYSTITAISTVVYGLVIDASDNLYIAGLAAVAAERIRKWNGSAWSALGSGATGTCYKLVIGPDGSLYVAAGAATVGGVTNAVGIARWNGTAWFALGTGLAGGVCYIVRLIGGLLHAGGDFTSAGGLALADRYAIWNGYTWNHAEVDLPGSAAVWAIATPNNEDIYLGYDTSGTAITAAITAVTNDGSQDAYPIIKIKRSGGTSATIEFIRNEATGKTMLLDYDLLDGETLTIDLEPGVKSVTSDFFGNVIGRTLLANSDFAAWALLPGDNDISVFVADVGSPTITATMLWRAAHLAVETAY